MTVGENTEEDGKEILAGWEARTRPLAKPLSPRGPQPVVLQVRVRAGNASMVRWPQKERYGGRGTLALEDSRSCVLCITIKLKGLCSNSLVTVDSTGFNLLELAPRFGPRHFWTMSDSGGITGASDYQRCVMRCTRVYERYVVRLCQERRVALHPGAIWSWNASQGSSM